MTTLSLCLIRPASTRTWMNILWLPDDKSIFDQFSYVLTWKDQLYKSSQLKANQHPFNKKNRIRQRKKKCNPITLEHIFIGQRRWLKQRGHILIRTNNNSEILLPKRFPRLVKRGYRINSIHLISEGPYHLLNKTKTKKVQHKKFINGAKYTTT